MSTHSFPVSPTCCCGDIPPPSGCRCALLFGQSGVGILPTPFSSYADALAAIAAFVINCVLYYVLSGDTGNTISTSFDGVTFDVSAHTEHSTPSLGASADTYFSVDMLAGGMLTVNWDITTDAPSTSILAELRKCSDGSLVDSYSNVGGFSGSFTLTAPDDGEYYVRVFGSGTLGFTTYATIHYAVTCSLDFWLNPAVATWNDGGTTRYLDSCPKLNIPLASDPFGLWYADCSEAHDAITNLTSNCVGYFQSAGIFDSFSATNGGSFITFAFTGSSGILSSGGIACCVNGLAGETISMAWSSSGGGGESASLKIYELDGTLIYDSTLVGTNPITSSALPYTGSFLVVGVISSMAPPPFTSGGFTVSSSGAMSVNPIQALYDIGLDCPGRLNCGDSCP